jgi:hypothetical protein
VARPIAHRSAEWSAKKVVSQMDSVERDLADPARPRAWELRREDFERDAPRRADDERLVVTVTARYRRPPPDRRILTGLPTWPDASFPGQLGVSRPYEHMFVTMTR